jgi:hypothetical protein
MNRKLFAAFALTWIFTSSISFGQSTVESCTYDYYRNKLWPTPFRAMDAVSVQAAFDQQADNGWRLYNTLSNSMFDAKTQRLTDAGKAHVQWIVTQSPQSRRIVFVLQGNNQQSTALRVESTQLAVSEVIPVGPLPSIYLTDREPHGSAGVYQTAINRAMMSSVPTPRLTASGGANAAPAAPAGGATP